MSADNIQLNVNRLAPAMPEDHKVKAIDLFSIPSSSYNETSMSIFIVDRLREIQKESVLSYEIDTYGNILIVKGDAEAFPCFCAHLDTVHTYENGFNVMEETVDGREYLYAQDDSKLRVGIGGDDKCGIFVCLHLLNVLDYVKIIFFSQEESGGIGSSNIDVSFFKDCMFLGGIDRWNGKDFVNSYGGRNTISKRFNRDTAPLLDKYGYFHSSGMFTDSFNVQERGINISCFNMSCGYYAHHSNKEYVDLNELWNACLLAEELGNLPPRRYHFQLPPSRISFGRWRNSETGRSYDSHWNKYSYNSYDRDWYDDKKDGNWCTKCGTRLFDSEIESYGRYCKPCYNKIIAALNEEADVPETFEYCKNCDLELTPHEKKDCDGYCYYCWSKLPQNDDGGDVFGTEEDDDDNDSYVSIPIDKEESEHCATCDKILTTWEKQKCYGYCYECWNKVVGP